jgi:hypothetical protein
MTIFLIFLACLLYFLYILVYVCALSDIMGESKHVFISPSIYFLSFIHTHTHACIDDDACRSFLPAFLSSRLSPSLAASYIPTQFGTISSEQRKLPNQIIHNRSMFVSFRLNGTFARSLTFLCVCFLLSSR